LLVLVVQRRRDIEVPQHVGHGRARLRVMSVDFDVRDDPAQQGQAAADTVMAGHEQFKRLVKASSRADETGKR